MSSASTFSEADEWQSACGKVILFGEHAVVYGTEALAGGIPNAVKARAVRSDNPINIQIPAWNIAFDLNTSQNTNQSDTTQTQSLVQQTFAHICCALDVLGERFHLEIEPHIPHASGLGASAAIAVAAIRAISACFGLNLSNEAVNTIAFDCEKLAHGSPSGLDNTLATYGGLMRFQRHSDQHVSFEPVKCAERIPLLIALSGKKGFTAETVARVRAARQQHTDLYNTVFADIGKLVGEAVTHIEDGKPALLAPLFNINQKLLRTLNVSCKEIERVLDITHAAGASGGKLTGSGDGGAVIVYADDRLVSQKTLLKHGFESFCIELG